MASLFGDGIADRMLNGRLAGMLSDGVFTAIKRHGNDQQHQLLLTLANLLRMRPIGVVSKKLMGARHRLAMEAW